MDYRQLGNKNPSQVEGLRCFLNGKTVTPPEIVRNYIIGLMR
jgi:hypothetical protein